MLRARHVGKAFSALFHWVLLTVRQQAGSTTLTLVIRKLRLQEANFPRTVPKSAHPEPLCNKALLLLHLPEGEGRTSRGRQEKLRKRQDEKRACPSLPSFLRVVAREREKGRWQRPHGCPGPLLLPL